MIPDAAGLQSLTHMFHNAWCNKRATAQPLMYDSVRNCRGSYDEFTVRDTELGNLSHVTIGHDSRGSMPSWHLESLTVIHVASGQQWTVCCGRWFGLHKEDGLTERDLVPSR